MDRPNTNILLTGPPGVGKTTLFMQICRRLAHHSPVGFYTREIRDEGGRKGFALVGLDGREGVLSHVDLRRSPRVGRYGVDVAGFERFLGAIPFRDPRSRLILIDEIGKMECLSAEFRKLVADLLDAPKTVVATVALKGAGMIAAVKKRPDVLLFSITPRNRDSLASAILAHIP